MDEAYKVVEAYSFKDRPNFTQIIIITRSLLVSFPLQYVPSQLREIPGYPDITHDNHYLMARTDGSIIDAKDHISSEVQVHAHVH